MSYILDPGKTPESAEETEKTAEQREAEIAHIVKGFRAAVQGLDYGQRVELRGALACEMCLHCFDLNPGCQCWNDD